MKERRQHRRIPHRIRVIIEANSLSDPEAASTEQWVCETRDISLTGLCIYSDAPLPLNTQLYLTIVFEDSQASFNLLGNVVWCVRDNQNAAYRAGIHLLLLPGKRSAWRNCVLGLLTDHEIS